MTLNNNSFLSIFNNLCHVVVYDVCASVNDIDNKDLS